MQKQLFFLFVAVLVGFSACKKSDSHSEFVINNIHNVDLSNTSSAVLALIIEQTSGSQEPVTLSVTGLPSGVIATINPVTGTPDFSASITFSQTASTTAGTYPIKIIGTSASYTKSYDLHLTVPAGSSSGQLIGTWRTTEEGEDVNSNGAWDAAEHNPIAASDAATVIFNANGTGSTSATVGSNPVTVPFTWNLQNNNHDLRLISTFSGTPDTSISSILTLTTTDLVVADSSGPRVTFTGLKKQ